MRVMWVRKQNSHLIKSKAAANIIVVIVPLFLVMLGCSRFIPGTAPNLFEGNNALNGAMAIKSKAGGDLNIIRVEIRPDKMSIVAQSPTNEKEQDEYTYEKGSATGPKPVMIHQVFAGLVPHTTPIDEVNWTAVPSVIEKASQLEQSGNAKVNLISMDNQRAETSKPSLKKSKEGEKWILTWRIFVESPRRSSYFWADTKGNLNEQIF